MPRPPMKRAMHERGHIPGEAAADRRDDVEHAHAQQRGFAPEAVGRPAAQQRAEHRAVQRRGHRHAVQARAEIPERLDFLLRAGNDHGVEAEEEPGQRRGDGPKEDACFHRMWAVQGSRFIAWTGMRRAASRARLGHPAGRATSEFVVAGRLAPSRFQFVHLSAVNLALPPFACTSKFRSSGFGWKGIGT